MDELEGAAYDELMDRLPPWQRQKVMGGTQPKEKPPVRTPHYEGYGFLRKLLWHLAIILSVGLCVLGLVGMILTIIFPPLAVLVWTIAFQPFAWLVGRRM